MTPQQEARLLRARAATLRAEATLFETIVLSELNGALIQTRIVEAVENETIAAELEAQAESKQELRDADNSCEQFQTRASSGAPRWCNGDGHYRCKECIHFDTASAGETTP